MKNKEPISSKQERMRKLTVGELRKILKDPLLNDSTEVFADYPRGWSGVFQAYVSNGRLFLLASDNVKHSGIGGGTRVLDTLLWESESIEG